MSNFTKNQDVQDVNKYLDFGPLKPFFYDPKVTEIKAQWNNIVVIREGKEFVADVTFQDEQHIRDVLDRVLASTGYSVSPENPSVKVFLPDGSRLIAHTPPVAVNGTIITIRRLMQGVA